MTTKVWPINFQIGQTFVVLVWTTKDKGSSNSLDPRTLVTNWSKSAKRPGLILLHALFMNIHMHGKVLNGLPYKMKYQMLVKIHV